MIGGTFSRAIRLDVGVVVPEDGFFNVSFRGFGWVGWWSVAVVSALVETVCVAGGVD